MKFITSLNKKLFIIHFSLFIILTSCQKVVNIDLNSSSPAIIIEANIVSEKGPYTVKITKSANYNQSNDFPAVSGAIVTLSDNAGNSENLIETSSGFYTTSSTQGVPGRTYTLTVVTDGKKYTATCSMPIPVDIISLSVVKSEGFRGKQTLRDVKVLFQDPPGIDNYYRFVEYDNGKPFQDIRTMSDRLYDGGLMSNTIRNDQDSVYAGDTIKVDLESIDEAMYLYYRELNRNIHNGGLSASPANPTSNFDNGAMGYFNAYSLTSKKTVIPLQ
jgi:hypothetical protein